MEVLSGVNNLKVPRLPGYNDEHRKLNGDRLIAVKQETHKPCESTDILDDRTYQATYSWCGADSQGVSNTYKDTREPSSHSDRSPDSVWFDGLKIDNDEI